MEEHGPNPYPDELEVPLAQAGIRLFATLRERPGRRAHALRPLHERRRPADDRGDRRRLEPADRGGQRGDRLLRIRSARNSPRFSARTGVARSPRYERPWIQARPARKVQADLTSG